MPKVISKKAEIESAVIEPATSNNVSEDVKKLLNTKPIRGFNDEMINGVKKDVEIMEKYALTRARFKNLIFEIACSGFDVSNLQHSTRKSFLKAFKCSTQGIVITSTRLKQNGICIQPGDNLNFIKISDTSFVIEVVK